MCPHHLAPQILPASHSLLSPPDSLSGEARHWRTAAEGALPPLHLQDALAAPGYHGSPGLSQRQPTYHGEAADVISGAAAYPLAREPGPGSGPFDAPGAMWPTPPRFVMSPNGRLPVDPRMPAAAAAAPAPPQRAALPAVLFSPQVGNAEVLDAKVARFAGPRGVQAFPHRLSLCTRASGWPAAHLVSCGG
jgi:hypothetical protein